MRIKSCLLAAILVFAIAPQAMAAATITWTALYPKTGNNAGEILVKGTSTLPDNTWSWDTANAAVWPKAGGAVVNYAISLNVANGNWGETAIDGLTSMADYNVVVSITFRKGTMRYQVSGAPAVAKAK